jgi:hypothetical protein
LAARHRSSHRSSHLPAIAAARDLMLDAGAAAMV